MLYLLLLNRAIKVILFNITFKNTCKYFYIYYYLIEIIIGVNFEVIS